MPSSLDGLGLPTIAVTVVARHEVTQSGDIISALQ
jgi:hypothetical protein